MRNILLSVAAVTTLATALTASDDYQQQIDALNKKITQLEKKQKSQSRMLSRVNRQSANDNIKWNIDFRSAFDNLDYKRQNADGVSNPSMFTNRLWLGMGAAPTGNLTFIGQIAVYGTWGQNNLPASDPFQNVNWRASSKPDDIVFKVRQAYAIYTFNKGSAHPMSFSFGRRAATDGFLANHREGMKKPGSPLAHITNMEVDAVMFKIDNLFGLPGSYVKFVAGRSYTNINQPSYSDTPYTAINAKDTDVNFFVVPMSLYNDGQVNLMAQYAAIFDFMGSSDKLISPQNPAGATTGAGMKHMGAVSLQIDGLNEDVDFLDSSTVFASAAFTTSDPKSGYKMLGTDKTKTGYSFWAGILVPDMITDEGRFGFEYNYGSKYWAPMTWAEDTLAGSKIATRGNAYEAYWNLPIDGRYFSAQIRYTYMDFDYKSNIAEFWADPELQDGDATSAQDVRVFVRYTY